MVDLSSPSLSRQGFALSAPGSDTGSGNANGGPTIWDRAFDAVELYDRARCAINPNARGCYQADPVVLQQQQENQRLWIYLGLGVVVLLLFVLLIIALKK